MIIWIGRSGYIERQWIDRSSRLPGLSIKRSSGGIYLTERGEICLSGELGV